VSHLKIRATLTFERDDVLVVEGEEFDVDEETKEGVYVTAYNTVGDELQHFLFSDEYEVI